MISLSPLSHDAQWQHCRERIDDDVAVAGDEVSSDRQLGERRIAEAHLANWRSG